MSLPSAPMLATRFTALDASPTAINFNDAYSVLQTKLLEGQENSLAIISTARQYEVQKYCTLSNPVRDGYWVLGNHKDVERLPKDIQDIVYREFNRAAGEERVDTLAMCNSLRADLQAKGLHIIDADQKAFKAALAKTR